MTPASNSLTQGSGSGSGSSTAHPAGSSSTPVGSYHPTHRGLTQRASTQTVPSSSGLGSAVSPSDLIQDTDFGLIFEEDIVESTEKDSRGATSISPKAKKLPSTFRVNNKFLTVEEMAKVLNDELDDATFFFGDSKFIRILFPKHLILLKLDWNKDWPTVPGYLEQNVGHRPAYLNQYFDADSESSITRRSTDSGSGQSFDNSFISKTPSDHGLTGEAFERYWAVEQDFEIPSDTSDLDWVPPPSLVRKLKKEQAEKEQAEKAEKERLEKERADKEQDNTNNKGKGKSNDGGNIPGQKAPKDEDLYRRWFNHIGQDLDEMASPNSRKSGRRFCAAHSTLPMEGVTPEKRKPDLILIPGEGVDPPAIDDWQSIFVVVEITKELNFPLRTMKECAQRGALVLHNSPGRRFVPILVISGRQYMILVYHRSGLTFSPRYDLVRNRNGFYFILLAFFFADPEALGFDPNIKMSRLLVPEKIKFQNKYYTIAKNLYSREGIQGRGTVCWEVICPDTGKRYVLKLTWANLFRLYKEIDFLGETKLHETEGVPILIAWEDSKVSGGIDTTARWKPPGDTDCVFIERTCRKMLLDGVGRSILYFNSKKELICAIIDIVETHYRLVLIGILHRDMSLWNMFLIDEYPKYRRQLRDDAKAKQITAVTPSTRPKRAVTKPSPEVIAEQSTSHELRQLARTRNAKVSSQSPSTSTSLDSARFSSSSETVMAHSFVVVTPQGGSSPVTRSTSEITPQANPRPSQDTRTPTNDQIRSEVDDLFSPAKPAPIARGLLSDFDYAAFLRSHPKGKIAEDQPLTEEQKWHRMRTGTMPFMAIEVLLGATTDKDFIHTYQHDFESIIYDLMAICMCQGGPRNTKRDFRANPIKVKYDGEARLPIDMWMLRDMTWVELGMQKLTTWAHLERWVLPSFDPYFEDMKGLFRELADAFWPGPPQMEKSDYDQRINCKVSYETFLGILRKYRDIVRG